MASVSTDDAGNRTVQFRGDDGRRHSIRLGKDYDLKAAREVARRVGALNAAKVGRHVIGRDLAEWLGSIGDGLHKKLEKLGLVSNRAGQLDMPALGPFLTDFMAKRAKAGAPNTASSLRVAANRLTEYFGEGRPLDRITPGDADEWLLWMTTTKEYAGATIGRTVKRARQFFRAAVRLQLLRVNPFADLKAPSQANEKRKFFITPATAAKVLDACPDTEWRLIFALSRFGGLRCPSEHLALKWADIDWARDRFIIRSPKTGDRWVPIFAELRPFLSAAFEAAADGAVYVITRRRDSAQRWGMLLQRILAKAGITAWERIFHNLRASRQTELTALYSIGTVCRWLGNSPNVADVHYLMAMEVEFERAAKVGGVVQNPVQQSEANDDKPLQTMTRELAETLKNTGNERKVPEACKSQGDPEHSQETQEKQHINKEPVQNPVHLGSQVNLDDLDSADDFMAGLIRQFDGRAKL